MIESTIAWLAANAVSMISGAIIGGAIVAGWAKSAPKTLEDFVKTATKEAKDLADKKAALQEKIQTRIGELEKTSADMKAMADKLKAIV